jgi:hypothetical protein
MSGCGRVYSDPALWTAGLAFTLPLQRLVGFNCKYSIKPTGGIVNQEEDWNTRNVLSRQVRRKLIH